MTYTPSIYLEKHTFLTSNEIKTINPVFFWNQNNTLDKD